MFLNFLQSNTSYRNTKIQILGSRDTKKKKNVQNAQNFYSPELPANHVSLNEFLKNITHVYISSERDIQKSKSNDIS